jgi:hypothetical protein
MNIHSIILALSCVLLCGCASPDQRRDESPKVIFGPSYTHLTMSAWVESHTKADVIPTSERLFALGPPGDDYAAIIRFRDGITIADVVGQTPLASTAQSVFLFHVDRPIAGFYYDPHSKAARERKLQPLDLLWIHTNSAPFKR